MKKVILDTNVLLIPGEHMVDVFEQIKDIMHEKYSLVVVDKTIEELEKLAVGKTKSARYAQLGLALVKNKIADKPTLWEKILGLKEAKEEILLVKSKEYADDAIVALADKDTYVATLDRELKKRVKEKGAQVITFTQKNRLKVVV